MINETIAIIKLTLEIIENDINLPYHEIPVAKTHALNFYCKQYNINMYELITVLQ